MALTAQEISERARRLYSEKLRAVVETPETIGQFITIDVLSGDYATGPDHIATVAAVRARHKNAQTNTIRIGYTTTYTHGGRMVRTA